MEFMRGASQAKDPTAIHGVSQHCFARDDADASQMVPLQLALVNPLR